MPLPLSVKGLPAVALLAAGAAVATGAMLAPTLGPGVWALTLLPLVVAGWAWGVRLGRVERALAASEARKAAVIDASPDAIISIDHQGLVREFNPAAARMFGFSRAAVVRHGVGEEYAFLQKPFSPAGLAKKVREVRDKA